MSVFSIGKFRYSEQGDIQLQSELEMLAQATEIDLKFGVLDPQDEAVLDESALLRGDGLVFNVFSPGENDVGSLWKEAAAAANKGLRTMGYSVRFSRWEQVQNLILPDQVKTTLERTHFGRFISGLFKIQRASSCGFGIFDNGIDQVIEGEPNNCKDLIYKTFLLNWDLGPNALFVWKTRT